MTIKELRKKVRMSQAVFAKAIGVSPTAVSCWERGVNSLSLKNIKKIEEQFNVKLDY